MVRTRERTMCCWCIPLRVATFLGGLLLGVRSKPSGYCRTQEIASSPQDHSTSEWIPFLCVCVCVCCQEWITIMCKNKKTEWEGKDSFLFCCGMESITLSLPLSVPQP